MEQTTNYCIISSIEYVLVKIVVMNILRGKCVFLVSLISTFLSSFLSLNFVSIGLTLLSLEYQPLSYLTLYNFILIFGLILMN